MIIIKEKNLETVIRDYLSAMENNDVNSALSFFTDDAIWYNPKGTFKGKKEIKEYIEWLFNTVSGIKFVEDGVGIIVQGNKGVFQHILECTIRGTKKKVPTFCTYLFEDQKFKIHWTIKSVD